MSPFKPHTPKPHTPLTAAPGLNLPAQSLPSTANALLTQTRQPHTEQDQEIVADVLEVCAELGRQPVTQMDCIAELMRLHARPHATLVGLVANLTHLDFELSVYGGWGYRQATFQHARPVTGLTADAVRTLIGVFGWGSHLLLEQLRTATARWVTGVELEGVRQGGRHG